MMSLLLAIFTTLYATYYYVTAVINKNEEERQRWVKYWIVISLLYITDMIFSPVLCSVLLLFWLVRLSVLVWCIPALTTNPLSSSRGWFSKHIDDNMGKAKEMFSVGVSRIKTVVTEVMEKVNENMLDQAVNSSKLLKDVAKIAVMFVKTSNTKLTEDFGKLTD